VGGWNGFVKAGAAEVDAIPDEGRGGRAGFGTRGEGVLNTSGADLGESLCREGDLKMASVEERECCSRGGGPDTEGERNNAPEVTYVSLQDV
jgi:hypothetical protein